MHKENYSPVPHDHQAFLDKARRREGFTQAYNDLEGKYSLARELLSARSRAGLTQEEVAKAMGTTKSAVSGLEAVVERTAEARPLRPL